MNSHLPTCFLTSQKGRGSGWVFEKIVQFDVRWVRASGTKQTIFFGRKSTSKMYKPDGLDGRFHSNFERLIIVDPSLRFCDQRRYPEKNVLSKKVTRNSSFIHEIRLKEIDKAKKRRPDLTNSRYFCVFECILLKMGLTENRKSYNLTFLRRLSSPKFYQLLSSSIIFDPYLVAIKGGISCMDFSKVESDNNFSASSPRLKNLFPGIVKSFKGISINLYRASKFAGQPKTKHALSLFPVATSQFCNNIDYLQVDLLQDSKELYSATFINSCVNDDARNATTKIRANDDSISHCFLITDLQKLLGESARDHNFARNNKKNYLCRKCLVTMLSLQSFESHASKCNTSRPGQNIFRASKNRFFHVPMRKEKMSGDSYKFVPNKLEFTTGSLFKCLKPCVLGTLDFEASSHKLEISSTNKNKLFRQRGLAYAVGYQNLYKHLPLPKTLQKVRLGFLDDEIQTTSKSFDREGMLILHLFETIRSDIHELDKYLNGIFTKKTSKLRPFSQLSWTERANYFKKTCCDLCGEKFGVKKINKKTGRPYILTANRDHDHLDFKCQERFILCSSCNLSLQSGYGSTRASPYLYYCHNGSK